MKLEFSQQIFEKYSNINFHENLSSGNRVVPCGQKDGRTDMTKLIAAFRIFANAPKNEKISCRIPLCRLNGASYEYATTRKGIKQKLQYLFYNSQTSEP
jgi:hypothetical protein